MELRPYQSECLESIKNAGPGRWLVQMATGLGKTVTFSRIPRSGRMLIISHRDELVRQPLKYFSLFETGVEKAAEHSYGEAVVSASVQTMARRLKNFATDEFETIITDECHHASADTYQEIYKHFTPRFHLGFTATPHRGDGIGLQETYDEIIFERDLKWGIENGWLSPIECVRVDVGYNISKVATKMGDLSLNELEEAVNIEGANKAIAAAIKNYADFPCLIFAVSVSHAVNIANLIPGAVAVSGKSKDRADVIDKYLRGEIPVLVNCALFTEGTDLPNTRTVAIARPTKSVTLYTQMAGRGTRLFPGKNKCRLVDFVGVSGKHNLCTAPSLIGLDLDSVPERLRNEVQGDLLSQLPALIEKKSDCPESWVKNAKVVDLWAKGMSYQTHDINWFKMPDGSLHLGLGGAANPKNPSWRKISRWIKLDIPDNLGRTKIKTWTGFVSPVMKYQEALDQIYKELEAREDEIRHLWDRKVIKRWEHKEASDKQKELLSRKGIDIGRPISKGEASLILTRLFAETA